MPTVAIVDGVLIMFYYNDHDPPHFHVEYGEFEGKISIVTLRMIDGSLPANKQRAVVDWASDHREELSAAWEAVRNRQKPKRIE